MSSRRPKRRGHFLGVEKEPWGSGRTWGSGCPVLWSGLSFRLAAGRTGGVSHSQKGASRRGEVGRLPRRAFRIAIVTSEKILWEGISHSQKYRRQKRSRGAARRSGPWGSLTGVLRVVSLVQEMLFGHDGEQGDSRRVATSYSHICRWAKRRRVGRDGEGQGAKEDGR